jgi:mannosyltransferase
LLRVIATHPGGGPHLLLLKPWVAISSDPVWTRLPSVIAMAIAVGGLVAFVRRAVDTPTAVSAGLLMILLPATSRWAQDNRPYAFATACIVIAVLCWWRSITGGSARWSVLYGAAVVAAGLFHLYALTVVPALVLAALWVEGDRRSALLRTIVPPAAAAIVLLPHLALNALHPTGTPSNPPVSLRSLAALVVGNYEGIILPAVMALLAIGGSLWAWQSPGRRAIVALGVGWVMLPVLSYVLARSLLGMPTLAPRYVIFLFPGGCLLAALGLAALYARWRAAAVVALVVVALIAVPQQVAVRSVAAHKPATDRLGSLLRQPELAGLPIVALKPGVERTIDAATYPDRIRTPLNATPRAVAVIVWAGRPKIARSHSPYLVTGSPWQPAIRCTPGPTSILVMAKPEASVPTGDPARLARRLNAAVPGARCEVISSTQP